MSRTYKIEFPNGETIELTLTEEDMELVERLERARLTAKLRDKFDGMAEKAERALEKALKELGK
jgi:hypothetical protein